MIQILEQDNYRVALGLARERFAGLDPAIQASRCGCTVEEKGAGPVIALPYLDLVLEVGHPAGSISVRGSSEPLSEWEQILALHYLGSEGPVPPEGEPIAYSQVPGGAFYDSAFQGRVRNHFLSFFAANPDLLVPAAGKLGGEKHEGTGDVSVRVPAFPRVSLYFSLWKADEEFPADMKLLLSSSIASYLSVEDIAVLGGLAAGKLIRYGKAAHESRPRD
jgi:hypothetical protein